MGFIKTLIGLVILAAIVVFGYWLYATKTNAPDAPYWAEINAYMPDPLRQWSCQQTKMRVAAAPATGGAPTASAAPRSCEGLW
jgi:hypothetical protein